MAGRDAERQSFPESFDDEFPVGPHDGNSASSVAILSAVVVFVAAGVLAITAPRRGRSCLLASF